MGTKKEEKREVVIEADRKRQIFLDCHFNDLGHHLGQKKTVHRIQRKYYWLGIIRDVVEWVRRLSFPSVELLTLPGVEWSRLSFQIKVCETCRHAERNKNLARTVRPLKVAAPWDMVGIDFIGILFLFPARLRAGQTLSPSQQGRFPRASRATLGSPFSSITSANGPKRSLCGGQTRSQLPDVFPNAFTGEEQSTEHQMSNVAQLFVLRTSLFFELNLSSCPGSVLLKQ